MSSREIKETITVGETLRKIDSEKSITASDSADVVLVRYPLRALQETIDNQRWFEGIVMSTVYLERFGVRRLEEYLKQRDVPVEPVVMDLGLGQIIRLLEGFGIVDHNISSLMGEVNNERNRVVHEIREPDAIDKEKAKITIQEAMECLKALGISQG